MAISEIGLYTAISSVFVDGQKTPHGKPGGDFKLRLDKDGNLISRNGKRAVLEVTLHRVDSQVEIKDCKAIPSAQVFVPTVLSVLEQVNEALQVQREIERNTGDQDEPLRWQDIVSEDPDKPPKGIEFVDPAELDRYSA